jgi:ligand-binding sensor domain-containing protein
VIGVSALVVAGVLAGRPAVDEPDAAASRRPVGVETPVVAAPVPAARVIVDRWRTFTERDGLPSSKVFTVRAGDGRVWVGTDRGASYWENDRWHTVDTSDGLAHRVVLAIDVDPRTGDVWLGTLAGLSRWSAGRIDSFDQFNSGLVNDVVYGVAVEGARVWAATAAGVSRYDVTARHWEIFTEQNAPMHEPWTYGVHAADGLVYIAAWGGGVLEYDLATDQWRDYRDPDEEMEIDLFPDDGLVHDVTTGVAYGSGVLWVGTYFGLSRYDGLRWSGYFDHDSGLPSNFINAVRVRGTQVWICTDAGLAEFDGEVWVSYARRDDGRGSVTVRREADAPARTTPSAIAHNYVLGVDFAGDTVWVATADGVSRGHASGATTVAHFTTSTGNE